MHGKMRDSCTRACWRSVWQQFVIKELLLSLSLIVTRDLRNSVSASSDLKQRLGISASISLKQSEGLSPLPRCLLSGGFLVSYLKRRIWKHFSWYYFPMIPRWDCFHLTIVFILWGSLFLVMTRPFRCPWAPCEHILCVQTIYQLKIHFIQYIKFSSYLKCLKSTSSKMLLYAPRIPRSGFLHASSFSCCVYPRPCFSDKRLP